MGCALFSEDKRCAKAAWWARHGWQWRSCSPSHASGAGLRLYVIDYPALKKKWENVEATVYAMAVQENALPRDMIFRLSARSNHHNIHRCPCDGRNYDAQFSEGADRKFRIAKEMGHSVYSDPATDHATSLSAYPPHPDDPSVTTFPRGQWIGLKLVIRTAPGLGVQIEAYRDVTDGRDGGRWEKLMEYIDRGQGAWGAQAAMKRTNLDDLRAGCVPDRCLDPIETGNYDPVLLRPGFGTYVRADGWEDIRFKNYSVREIEPLP